MQPRKRLNKEMSESGPFGGRVGNHLAARFAINRGSDVFSQNHGGGDVKTDPSVAHMTTGVNAIVADDDCISMVSAVPMSMNRI